MKKIEVIIIVVGILLCGIGVTQNTKSMVGTLNRIGVEHQQIMDNAMDEIYNK